jgi:hypothetical protein
MFAIKVFHWIVLVQEWLINRGMIKARSLPYEWSIALETWRRRNRYSPHEAYDPNGTTGAEVRKLQADKR